MLSSAARPAGQGLERQLQLGLVALLVLVLFTLPLVEAPKNFAVGLYALAWCVRAGCTGDFGGRWDRYDTAFAAMLGSAVLSAYAGGYTGDLSGTGRVLVLAWLVKRSPPFSARDGVLLAGAACTGLLPGIVLGMVPFLRGERLFLELPSVGHVNQSALYIAALAVAAFGWWLQGAHAGLSGARRQGLAVCAVVFGGALLASGSRGAMLAAVVGALLVVAGLAARGVQLRRVLRRVLLALVLLASIVILLGLWKPGLADGKLTFARQITTVSMDQRIQHWRMAAEAWRRQPWVGHGPDAFRFLTVEEVCRWRVERGASCEPGTLRHSTHVHSLYVATLVERGLLGLLALAVLLAAWAGSLWRGLRAGQVSPWWIASAAGFVVVVVGGIFNTTLRVEHGSLALLGFGLHLASLRHWPPAAPRPSPAAGPGPGTTPDQR